MIDVPILNYHSILMIEISVRVTTDRFIINLTFTSSFSYMYLMSQLLNNPFSDTVMVYLHYLYLSSTCQQDGTYSQYSLHFIH